MPKRSRCCCGCGPFSCEDKFNRINIEVFEADYDLPLGNSRTLSIASPLTITEFVTRSGAAPDSCQEFRNFSSYGVTTCAYTDEVSDGGVYACSGRTMELATPVIEIYSDSCAAVSFCGPCTRYQKNWVRPGLTYVATIEMVSPAVVKFRVTVTAAYMTAQANWEDAVCNQEPVTDATFWTGRYFFVSAFAIPRYVAYYEPDGVVTGPFPNFADWYLPYEWPNRFGVNHPCPSCGWMWQRAVYETEWTLGSCTDFYNDRPLTKISDTGPLEVLIPRNNFCGGYYGSGGIVLMPYTGPDLFANMDVTFSLENV